MKPVTTVGFLACALFCVPLAAAQSKPAPPAPTAQKAPAAQAATAKVGAADTAFAKQTAMDGIAEVEHGRLAADKATNPDVKQFGQRMVDDHTKANDELKSWASTNNVTLPADMGPQHKAMQDKLSKMSGDAFDKAYMAHMVSAHAKAVAAFQRESKSGGNADLKAWADKTLPTLQEHHTMARSLNTKVAGAKTPPAAKKGADRQ